MTDSTHYNILLVEDNAPNVLAATAYLDLLGCTYVVANDGIQAIKAFVEHSFDVILMDIQMPSLDGIETAGLIHVIGKKISVNTPIIAMTAHMYQADMSKLGDTFDDFIPKPFHPDYFEKTLGKYCKLTKK